MPILDLEVVGWLRSRGDKPWAFVPEVEPTFGLTFDTVEDLETAIAETPELFIDGTPVYVTTIDYDTPLGDDPVSEPGWVVVYSLTPVPLTPPSPTHLEHWIDVYETPDGTGTSWLEYPGDPKGGLWVNIGGDPAPTDQVNPGALCSGTMSSNELDLPLHPISQVSGEGTGLDTDLLTDVGNIL